MKLQNGLLSEKTINGLNLNILNKTIVQQRTVLKTK